MHIARSASDHRAGVADVACGSALWYIVQVTVMIVVLTER